MKILLWIAVPIVGVTTLAWLVNRIAARPKAPMTPEESMQAHERFLRVLETPVPFTADLPMGDSDRSSTALPAKTTTRR